MRLAESCGRRGSFGRRAVAACCWSDWEGQSTQAGAPSSICRTANEAGGGCLGPNTLPFSEITSLEHSLSKEQLGCKNHSLLSHNFDFVSVERKIYTSHQTL